MEEEDERLLDVNTLLAFVRTGKIESCDLHAGCADHS